jgi:hypothetical protein
VATSERREAVEQVVRETAPELDVHNELSVTEDLPPGPSESVS